MVAAKPAPWRPKHAMSGGGGGVGSGSVAAMMEAGRSSASKKIAPPPKAADEPVDPVMQAVKKYKAVSG